MWGKVQGAGGWVVAGMQGRPENQRQEVKRKVNKGKKRGRWGVGGVQGKWGKQEDRFGICHPFFNIGWLKSDTKFSKLDFFFQFTKLPRYMYKW